MWRYDDDSDEGEAQTSMPPRIEEQLIRSRTIFVAEPISDKTYRRVASALTLMEASNSKEAIRVFVNSPGGSADSGFAIYDLLRFSSCPITTLANGLVASSAVLVFLSADEGQCLSLPHSRFLLHQPSTYARGQASDIDITAKEIVKTREKYNRIIEEKTGRSLEELQKDAERDFWLSPSEANEYGLVDKILKASSDL
jgi:ATP-dependent Clp protease, protease subunit